MNAIRFSICKDRDDPIEPFEVALAPFNQAHSSPVELHIIPWDNYKQELTAMALYGQGVDVSQVGAPVVNDLVAMNSLRPYTQKEIDSFGGASVFAPVAWNKMLSINEESEYAVPWIVDPRAIIYWRDMFEDAGVDEATAFTSFENMEQAFERLQEKGFQTPGRLPLPTS
jgi:multiple sugar transport system substrate-binding protein